MKLFEVAADREPLAPHERSNPPQIAVDAALKLYKEKIVPRCQQYLTLVGGEELYRGMREDTIMGEFKTHANRNPKDTGIITHGIVNDIFQYETGIRIRSSNALFATTDIAATYTYGKPYVIFVPGKVTYTFLAGIYDLTDQLGALVRGAQHDDADTSSPGYIQQMRDTLTDKITPLIRHNKYIDQAIKNSDEIIFTTPNYYAIRWNLWEKMKAHI
jgi:hypothetical protein